MIKHMEQVNVKHVHHGLIHMKELLHVSLDDVSHTPEKPPTKLSFTSGPFSPLKMFRKTSDKKIHVYYRLLYHLRKTSESWIACNLPGDVTYNYSPCVGGQRTKQYEFILPNACDISNVTLPSSEIESCCMYFFLSWSGAFRTCLEFLVFWKFFQVF